MLFPSTKEPKAAKFIRPFISADEFINGQKRWCIWLKDADPNEIRALPEIKERINNVKILRLNSPRKATQKLASFPTLFGEIRQPVNHNYILIPRHSSERRKYIPIGFFTPNSIAADSCLIIPEASLFDFGILTSAMHMAWVKYICGRIKSDYRYSNTIVYNNYPFPIAASDKQHGFIESAAQAILDVRARFPDSSLAVLYDPLSMPPELSKAHSELDRAVDKCYGQSFDNDNQRIQTLFKKYQEMTGGLFISNKSRKKKQIEIVPDES